VTIGVAMPVVLRCLVGVVALCPAAAAIAQSACVKPETPACAVARVPFPNDDAADDCRKDMLRFRDAMDVYATCLGQSSQNQETAARNEYEDVRVRFNRRARGEF
jgi:hypothetical protein